MKTLPPSKRTQCLCVALPGKPGIKEHFWPSVHLPHGVMTDNGPLFCVLHPPKEKRTLEVKVFGCSGMGQTNSHKTLPAEINSLPIAAEGSRYGGDMPSRRKHITGAAIERRLKQGFGQGEGADYKPWLRISDVPSRGTCAIMTGWKHGREHHLLSRLERNYFYLLEWDDNVLEVQEQKPLLPLMRTQQLAVAAGVRHPMDHNKPVVMTTDFFFTIMRGGEIQTVARAVKTDKDLANKRVLEKLDIERRYWQEQGVDWAIVTDKEVPEPMWRSIEWLHECRNVHNLEPITVAEVDAVRDWMACRLKENPIVCMWKFGLEADSELRLRPGTSLKVLRHLLANKVFKVDIRVQLRPDIPIAITVPENCRG